jgi:L-seryl-tRNA(Ser) seleniumtransferase
MALAPDAGALSALPKIDELVAAAEELARQGGGAVPPRFALVEAARREVERRRREILAGTPGDEVTAAAVVAWARRLSRPSLRPVINATGVVVHTNLGRAPLAERAVAQVAEVARGYSNLEYDLDGRERGSRHTHLRQALAELTGAEDAVVTNNCAAAVLVALAATAAGREVVVSRGELVEIGGAFRVPDVMRASGARLVEVGTTNKTHRGDYEAALCPDTALILKVHRSNFAIVGFTAEVAVAELVALGRARGVPVMVDLGSGALVDLATLTAGRLEREPTVPEIVAAGASLVAFSGDKLLGGPQAGIIVGDAVSIQRVKKHPLMRAVRPDKLTLAALEATLAIYREGPTAAAAEIPVLRRLAQSDALLRARAEALAARLRARSEALAPGLLVEVVATRLAVGGGALPLCEPSSWAVALLAPGESAERLEARLRRLEPPIVGRISDDRLLLDVCTMTDAEVATILA